MTTKTSTSASARRRPKGKSGEPKRDVYEIVTEKVIALLEEGTVPWRKPWRNVGDGLQRNGKSMRAYRGLNQLLLSLTPYASPYWLSVKQANELGGTIRKGEKSDIVTFWKRLERKAEPGDRGAYQRDGKWFTQTFFLRYYRVFNIEQIDGLSEAFLDKINAELPDVDTLPECDETIRAYIERFGINLRHGGDRACYFPQLDSILLPEPAAFRDVPAYHGTAFHEAVHSTGHKTRLSRDELTSVKATFGSEPYAKEELTAEMGAAMLCAIHGIDTPTIAASAAYVQSWLGKLRDDKRFVVSAASRAQAAVDLIYVSRELETEPDTTEPERAA